MATVTSDVEKPKSRASSLVEAVLAIAVAVGLALLIQAFVAKPYRIPSGSMEPTLIIGQRVLVNRVAMDFSEPHVGGVYVFHPPADVEEQMCGPVPHAVTPGRAACATPESHEASVNFIKPLVAGPGDEIYIKGDTSFARPPAPAISLPRKTPTSLLAAKAQSATSPLRSRSRRVTGS